MIGEKWSFIGSEKCPCALGMVIYLLLVEFFIAM
jgi:hypothetical protein